MIEVVSYIHLNRLLYELRLEKLLEKKNDVLFISNWVEVVRPTKDSFSL